MRRRAASSSCCRGRGFLEYAQARSFVVLLPWTWMRHVYALLGLCRRFGDARVEKICAIALADGPGRWPLDRKSTRLNSSHGYISYAVFCLKKKKKTTL